MKKASIELLLKTASKDNILTLTTRCATNCLFCSHKQNPPIIDTYFVDDIDLDDASTIIQFLDPSRDIIIGESATRICEGEPFLHNNIIEILRIIRNRYKHTKIKITTSAVPLDEEKIAILRDISNIELNISLNSASTEGRERLFLGRSLMSAKDAVSILGHYDIKLNGSIVAMPHIVGWKDIEQTIDFFNKSGCETIRLFMNGYTKFNREIQSADYSYGELLDFTKRMRQKLNIPLILEPSFIDILSADICGVIKDTPADLAGLRCSDTILMINDYVPRSRVDAFFKIKNLKKPKIAFLRENKTMEVALKKEKGQSSGLVFDYDIHPDTVSDIERAIIRHGKRGLLLTSYLAYPMLRECFEDKYDIEIQKVVNKFFGGNIMCAGLLTVSDIIEHIQFNSNKPSYILIPPIMLDDRGRDIAGEHYMNIYEKTGIKTHTI